MITCLRFMLLSLGCCFAGCHRSGHYTNISYPAGGYAYPLQVEAKSADFPFYPLRDKMSLADSFSAVWLGRQWLPAYNEPNLSIAPAGHDVFRFSIFTAFSDETIITLKDHEIVVKRNKRINSDSVLTPWWQYDTMKLTALERLHENFLNRWFPVIEKRKAITKPYRLSYIDSMTALYPQLLSTAYYFKLLEKQLVAPKTKFTYNTIRIALSEKQYINWIKLLNQSEFWRMPYTKECNSAIADGVFYIMEASTKEKYNCVEWNTCPGDTSNFYKACDSLVKLARLQNDIQVVWVP